MKLRPFLAIVGAWIFLSVPAFTQTPTTPKSSIRLDEGETRVLEVTLAPGESSKGEVATTVPIVLGFRTDVGQQAKLTKEQREAYMKKNIITLEAASGGAMSSTFGGSTDYKPKGGKIPFTVKNNSDLTVQVLVYSEKVKERVPEKE